MSDVIEILKLAKKTVDSFSTQRKSVTEKPWEEVALALDKLTELSSHHVKAVAEVTAPILSGGDLIETSRRYGLLVNDPFFPLGYDMIRGILVATRGIPTFQDPSLQEKMKAVFDKLYSFQYGVFTLAWDSYRVADAFAEAAQVAAHQQPSSDDIARAAAPFIKTFTGLFQDASEHAISKRPTTVADLVALLKSWCQSWQRHVQRTLYGGQGLNSAISQLKMQRYA